MTVAMKVTIDCETRSETPNTPHKSVTSLELFHATGNIPSSRLMSHAVHAATGMPVTLKLLPHYEFSDLEFISYKHVASRFTHPHILHFHAPLNLDLAYGLVFEPVSDDSLQQYLASSTPLPISEALTVFRHILLGLYALHSQGIPWLAVSAENVLMTTNGNYAITDFTRSFRGITSVSVDRWKLFKQDIFDVAKLIVNLVSEDNMKLLPEKFMNAINASLADDPRTRPSTDELLQMEFWKADEEVEVIKTDAAGEEEIRREGLFNLSVKDVHKILLPMFTSHIKAPSGPGLQADLFLTESGLKAYVTVEVRRVEQIKMTEVQVKRRHGTQRAADLAAKKIYDTLAKYKYN